MKAGEPSRTARSAAAHRAAHQLLEQGRIFADPLALAILGEPAETVAEEAQSDPSRRRMRLFIAMRTRLAEEAIGRAAEDGVGQLVVLGAGLDSFAYRNPHPRLHVFEMDHPATQAWKRRRLADAKIDEPASLTFAPIDFERETLPEALARAGFDNKRPAFFSWLGVVPYLTQEAVFATLSVIGQLAPGTQVMFDYGDPPETLPPEGQARHEAYTDRVAALGEPWISHFDPVLLAEKLRALGFTEIDDRGRVRLAARFFAGLPTPPSDRGGHVILAGIG
jgi:methyltransferase (TIGR00027 family)